MSRTLVVGDLRFELRPSKRRKTLGITVDRDGHLYLAAPANATKEEIERVVRRRRFWVYTKLAEKEALFRTPVRKEFVAGEGFFYLGRSYRLRLAGADGSAKPLSLTNGRFLLSRGETRHGQQRFIRWYSEHALPRLSALVVKNQERFGVTARRVLIRDVGNRWASCGRKDALYFHWRVILLPPRVIQYIVLHELVHLREAHHSPEFWRLLGRAMPDFAERKQWLAENGSRYY